MGLSSTSLDYPGVSALTLVYIPQQLHPTAVQGGLVFPSLQGILFISAPNVRPFVSWLSKHHSHELMATRPDVPTSYHPHLPTQNMHTRTPDSFSHTLSWHHLSSITWWQIWQVREPLELAFFLHKLVKLEHKTTPRSHFDCKRLCYWLHVNIIYAIQYLKGLYYTNRCEDD